MKCFDKYPNALGGACLGELCAIARRHGMYIIAAYKVGMHVYHEIGLYGSSEQMASVTKKWAAKGNELKPRSFKAVFGVGSKRIAPSNWLDIPKDHREWCEDKSHVSRHHCDFDPRLSHKTIAALEAIRDRLVKRESRNAESSHSA